MRAPDVPFCSDFSSDVVVVTGGTKGIGLQCALRFSSLGARVVLLYHSDDEAAGRVSPLFPSERLLIIKADVTSPDALKEAHERIRAVFGYVSVLVNNAGISRVSLLSDMELSEWDAVIATNLTSVFLCCKEFLPDMYAQTKGAIVNISSVFGVEGGAMEGAYSASKAGVIGLTKALAKEVGRMGIRVNAVAPGFIDTEMNAHLNEIDRAAWAEGTALNRIGEGNEVASAVCFLASGAASYITGETLCVKG